MNANGDALPPPPPVDHPRLWALKQTSPFGLVMLPLGFCLLKSKKVGSALVSARSARRIKMYSLPKERNHVGVARAVRVALGAGHGGGSGMIDAGHGEGVGV